MKWFVVHHTGQGPYRPTVYDTQVYQCGSTALWPFPGIAYSMYVEADGTLSLCHDLEEETWANGVGSPSTDANGEGIFNEYTISCCFSGQDPTDAQWVAVQKAYQAACAVTGRALTLTGHRLVAPGTTECPGDVAASRLKSP